MRLFRHIRLKLICIVVCLAASIAAHAKNDRCLDLIQDLTPAERLERPLKKMEKHFLRLSESNEEPTPIFKKIRQAAYQASLLAEVYGDVYGAPFHGIRAKINRLKSSLGKFVDAHNHLKLTVQLRKEHPQLVSRGLIQYLENNKKLRYEELQDRITEDNWVLNSSGEVKAINKIRKKLSSNVVYVSAGSTEDIFEFIDDHLKQITKQPYDMGDFSEGVHEFRKDIRFFLLFHNAFRGLFTVPAETVQKLEADVKKLGMTKDAGEYMDVLYEYHREQGFSKKESMARTYNTVEGLYDVDEMGSIAGEVFDDLIELEMIVRLRYLIKNSH
ncbi:MAG: hypothetical protein KDD38_04100 [Bdellovibrionales bacterium]|nr:hypothetical protein [Bdellovibrionales bacterium]